MIQISNKTYWFAIICLSLALIINTFEVVNALNYNVNVKITPQGSNITKVYHAKTTGSMRPLIVEHTESEFIQLFPNDELYVGDVCTYRWENKSILHRIVFITAIEGETFYVFKGDNNLYPDQRLVPKDLITHRMISVRWD